MTNLVTAEYTITKTFAAPIDEVFAAWTDPERLAQWFWPAAFPTPPRATLDLKVGGKWEVAMTAPDGIQVSVGGTYLRITPPYLVAFTTGDPDNTDGALASKVTVELKEDGGTTKMTFHQAGVNTPPEHAEEARAGWLEFFDRLDSHLR